MDVPPIQTPRLELVSMSVPFIEAILDEREGDAEEILGIALPPEPAGPDVTYFLSRRLEQIRGNPGVLRWLARAIVLREGRTMVGNVGFHGEPGVNAVGEASALEIGYGILPEYRGRGYATATTGAVTAELLRFCDEVVLNVRADNPPALQAYRKLGYREHVRFEERLGHRRGSALAGIAAPFRRLLARRETDRR